MAFGAWLPYSPLASSLGLTHLPAMYWPILLLTLLAYTSLTQDSDVAPRIDFGLTAAPHNLLLFKAKPQVPPGAATKASVTCPYGQLIGE